MRNSERSGREKREMAGFELGLDQGLLLWRIWKMGRARRLERRCGLWAAG